MTEKPLSKYSKLYLPHDKYVVFNQGDNELRPWGIRLPEPPDLRYIEGYGEPPEKQKFKHEEEPARLKILAQTAHNQASQKYEGRMVLYMQIKIFWQLLSDSAESYKEEINFIKRVQWHLQYGYWFYVLGKPTWITPWHYHYLNFYYPNTLRGKRVDYRDEDRITELFEWYCYTCTETFKNLDEKGVAVPNEDGVYEMIDVGHRVCFGSAQPKRRRKGESMKANNKAKYGACREKEHHAILQANTGEAAEELYQDHMLPSWKKYPLWLRPIYDGNFDSTDGIYLRPPSSVSNENYFDSWIQWNGSAKEGVNDRKKIHTLVSDEEAKNLVGDSSKRWSIDKLTLAQGQIIHGYSIHISTVEEMTAGGVYFQTMCDQSNFYQRIKANGQTISGLFRIFRPVYMGSDGFIDEYGQSVINEPTEFQLKHPAKDSIYHIINKGAKQYWEEYFEEMVADPTKHANYRLEIRKNPMRYADCWIGGAGDMGWNYVLLDQRIAELRTEGKQTVQGDLKRRGTEVDFIENPQGKFIFSDLLLGRKNPPVFGESVWNEKKGSFVPAHRPMYTTWMSAGGDPFDYGSGQQNKTFHLSNGGGSVVSNPDPQESEKNIKDWESFQLICYYDNRPPSLEEYCEDMLAMCIYCGALINVESNKKRLIEYFIDEGFGGYLWRGTNPDGTIKKEYGTYAGGGTKNDMLNGIRDFIEYRAHKTKIKEFLVDAKEVTTPAAITKKDALASAGWAIYAAQRSDFGRAIERVFGDGDFNFDDYYGEQADY